MHRCLSVHRETKAQGLQVVLPKENHVQIANLTFMQFAFFCLLTKMCCKFGQYFITSYSLILVR